MSRKKILMVLLSLACCTPYYESSALSSKDCDEEFFFRCQESKACISKAFICDGEPDCGSGDRSDELSCHLLTTPAPLHCPPDEFQCSDRLCIPRHWVCDQENDCADASDETLGCSTGLCEGFQCHSGHCIPEEWECDGNRDCPDNSDEDHCAEKEQPVDDCELHDGWWRCSDRSKCVRLAKTCNRHADCPDGSDEGSACFLPGACEHVTCSPNERCLILPSGAECLTTCATGYKFKNGICSDINECETFGKCDQVCTNTIGGYNCSCIEGYTLHNGTCKADGGEGMLMFSSNDQVRAYFLTSHVYYQVAGDLPHAAGIAYDGIHMYWTTIADREEAIVKSDEQGKDKKVIVTSGLGAAEDLAVDWLTGILYFTDAEFKRIGVCSNDGFVCSAIHEKDIDRPRAIVLHTNQGLMYWSDWGVKPMIVRSGMDGSHPFEFVTEDIHWPNGLSLDLGSGRLFWVDAKISRVECIKFDGTDRKTIPNEAVKHPFSIEIFENRIYWSDWESNEILHCHKFTGHDCHVLIKERNHKIYGIHIYHPSLIGPKVVNPCFEAHCSDLCLLGPHDRQGQLTYTCVCPPHKKLSRDNHTCVHDFSLQAVVVGSGQTLVRVEHKTFGGFLTESVTLQNLRKVGALTHDPVSDQIIISDLIMKTILVYDWVKKETELLIEHVGRVVGMEVDYYANNLYWVDEERKTVEVMNLRKKAHKTLLRDFGTDTPTDIALVLESGFMYVASFNPSGAHIDRISLDGRLTSRVHVIEKDLIGPLSLFYDIHLGSLLWADRNAGKIMITDKDGQGRHTFKEMNSAPMDLTALDSDIFWSTYGSKKIFWSHKFDSAKYSKEFEIDQLVETDQIKLVGIHTDPLKRADLCEKAGNCSHLCLLSGANAVCACPNGMELLWDGLTCQPQLICKEDEYKCGSGECIPRALKCNGRQDCTHGEDEEHCLISCPAGMFRCANGRQCITHIGRCNKKPDCDDSSDEHNCDLDGKCSPHEFHCGSGECIPMVGKCDTKDDCADGSDEENCANSSCSEGEFQCSSGSCIPASWECDRALDCLDGSDEGDKCTKKAECKEFKCDNGHCVNLKLKCNGEDDCEDMSDEANCPLVGEPEGNRSREGGSCPYSCPSEPDLCLPLEARCNGKEECPKGEDELSCSSCSENQFACASKRCIPQSWVCDTVNDCGDDSDEAHCDKDVVQVRTGEEGSCDGFRCKHGNQCIGIHKLCDLHPDCPDASDEEGLCGEGKCGEAGCSQRCKETPDGPRCDCHPGYVLLGDGRTCRDMDECHKRSSCSQLCQNTLGSYKCSCHQPDYQLKSDMINCKARGSEMVYYYATQKEIKFKSQSLQETGLLFRSKTDLGVRGIDFDMKNDYLFWTSEMNGQIIKMSTDDSKETTNISSLIRPTTIHFDWISENVYVLENHKTISVCNFLLSKCTAVYTSDNDVTIKGLVIDPIIRSMFWAETTTYIMQHSKTVLMKASMSGDHMQTVLNLSSTIIGDIVLDPLRNLLYWSDIQQKKVERCTYDGMDRETVLVSELPQIKLMIFEDNLYWLNGKPDSPSVRQMYPVGTLTKYGLYGSSYSKYEQIRILPRVTQSEISDIRLHQTALQPKGNNPCKKIKCSEFCLIGYDHPVCMCHDIGKTQPGMPCPGSGIDTVERQPSGGDFAWGWWFFGLISLAALGYATYYLYSNFYEAKTLAGNVFFSNESQVPGSGINPAGQPHAFENPLLGLGAEQQVKIVMNNQIDITSNI